MSDTHLDAQFGNSARATNRAPRLLLVGDAMLDRHLVGGVDWISQGAPVPVLHVQRSFCRPGGAGKVAVSMAAMGASPDLVAVIGIDDAGRQFAAALSAESVADDMLVASATARTAVNTRLLAGNSQIAQCEGERPFVDDAARARIVQSVRERMPLADVAVIADGAMGVCDITVCRTLIEAARGRGVPVIVNTERNDFGRYAGASVLTARGAQAATAVGFALHGVDDAIRAGQLLRRDCSIDAVVISLGDQGVVLVAADGTAVIPTRAQHAHDMNGMRDAAVATIAVALGRGCELSAACLLADAAASLQVGPAETARITWEQVVAATEQRPVLCRNKVVSTAQLQEGLQLARAAGKKVGFTNGCFDILHHGHVALLEAAARECDVLVVGVNSDASVTRLKGPPRPFVPAAERKAILAGLSAVTWVCEFDEATPLELIRLVQPDVLVKGADYTPHRIVGADIVVGRGGKVITPVLVPGVSTTMLVDRLRQAPL